MPVWPAGFDAEVFALHARALLKQWMSDFRWQGRPLADRVAAVTAYVNDDRWLLWNASTVDTRPAPRPPVTEPTLPESLAGAVGDWTHPAWGQLAEAWALTGRWLHPQTRWSIDPIALARNGGQLYIACVDRHAPHAPRRYDPARDADTDPHTTDLGVIAFPLHPHQALVHLAAGLSPAAAMLAVAGTGLVAAGVHEALETFQRSPGEPIWDPHLPGPPLTASLLWRDPIDLITAAYPSESE